MAIVIRNETMITDKRKTEFGLSIPVIDYNQIYIGTNHYSIYYDKKLSRYHNKNIIKRPYLNNNICLFLNIQYDISNINQGDYVAKFFLMRSNN